MEISGPVGRRTFSVLLAGPATYTDDTILVIALQASHSHRVRRLHPEKHHHNRLGGISEIHFRCLSMFDSGNFNKEIDFKNVH